MRLSAIVLPPLFVVSLVAIGCSSATEKITAPSGIDPNQAIGSTPDRGPAPERPTLPPPGGTCNAAGAQSVIGERATSQLLERARLAAQASIARFIRPNEPITTEFLGSRLNLQLDDRDIVRGVSCG